MLPGRPSGGGRKDGRVRRARESRAYTYQIDVTVSLTVGKQPEPPDYGATFAQTMRVWTGVWTPIGTPL
jgi:hypothetical protein